MATFFTSTWTHPRPIFLQQFRFKLLHLLAGCADQILPTALANGGQILLADDATIQNPDPSGFAILTVIRL